MQKTKNKHNHYSFVVVVIIGLCLNISGNIQISWLNETSAFVALYKKDNANVGKSQTTELLRNLKIISESFCLGLFYC